MCPLSAFLGGCTCDFVAEDVPSLQLHVLEHLKQYFDIDNQVIELGNQASTPARVVSVNPDPVFPVPGASSSGAELAGPNPAVASCHSLPAQPHGLHGRDVIEQRRRVRDTGEAYCQKEEGRKCGEHTTRYRHGRCDDATGLAKASEQLGTENQVDGLNHDVDNNASHGASSTCSGLREDIRYRAQGPETHKGSPHPQIWRIVLTEMITAAKALDTVENEQNLQEAVAIVEKHLKGLADSGPKKAYFHIRQAQVRATRDEKKGILKFEVSQLLESPRSTQMAILYIAETLGGSVLEGTEAATDLERKIQNHIDKLK